MTTEIVYISHNNINQLRLRASGVPQDLSAATKITATFRNKLISSEDPAGGGITWNQSGYLTGEIRLDLGAQSIPSGTYDDVYVVVYDGLNTDGIVWGSFPAEVMKEVEA